MKAAISRNALALPVSAKDVLRAAVLRDSRVSFAANRAVIRDVCGYFRARTKLALGENAGMGKRLEYRLLTQGTRAGFFLSRVVSAGRRGGTWLR